MTRPSNRRETRGKGARDRPCSRGTLAFRLGLRDLILPVVLLVIASLDLSAQETLATTNTAAAASLNSDLSNLGASLIRLLGALALVLALFLGGVWFVKNRRFLCARQGRLPNLRVLEAKSIGPRQSLLLIAYRDQRLLVGASPAGVSLVTHLPAENLPDAEAATPAPSFMQAIENVLQNRA